jgi:hypothetical protein
MTRIVLAAVLAAACGSSQLLALLGPQPGAS